MNILEVNPTIKMISILLRLGLLKILHSNLGKENLFLKLFIIIIIC